jgi:hypothetical protein
LVRFSGYEVDFVATPRELNEVASRGPSLVIADPVFFAGADVPRQIAEWRHSVGLLEVPILLTGGADPEKLRLAVSRVPRVGVLAALAPMDHLLFAVNELTRPDVTNLRSSRRILYSAVCAFREAGGSEASHGVTYNVSESGLFIRTLDAPVSDREVWLEFVPAPQVTLVHLRGRVVWVNGLSGGAGRSAPPGFGVLLVPDECPQRDLQRFRAAYEGLRRSQAEPTEAPLSAHPSPPCPDGDASANA